MRAVTCACVKLHPTAIIIRNLNSIQPIYLPTNNLSIKSSPCKIYDESIILQIVETEKISEASTQGGTPSKLQMKTSYLA